MSTRREFLKTAGAGAAVLAAARAIGDSRIMTDEAMPALTPKRYRIGIAPSHITTPPDGLFQPGAEWQKLAARIDLYKYYGVQVPGTSWCSKVSPKRLVTSMKAKGIAIGSEFGNFGRDSVAASIRQHKPIFDAGGTVASMHLDGPVRRMLKGVGKGRLTLARIVPRLVEFWQKTHTTWPKMQIGWITNFPNWDYRDAFPGFNGHWTDGSGVTFHQALTAVHDALTKAGERIAFVEVDCPFGYYQQRKTRKGDAKVNNPKKFLALQKGCEQRGIAFHIIINNEVPGRPGAQLTPTKQAAADRTFHDGTLEYIRRLRKDGIFPDVFLIQSWYVAPREHLPETRPHTFTHTALAAAELIKKLYPRRPKGKE